MAPQDPDEEIYRELARLGVDIEALRGLHPTRKALGEFLAETLKLLDKKLYPEREEKNRIASVQACDHIFAVYPDVYSKLDEAFSFLRDGLERGEAILLITDDMARDDALKRMSHDWNIDAHDLQKKGDILVRSARAWYFPTGVFDSCTVTEKWRLFAKVAESRGKAGLRVFGDTSAFFRHGFGRALVEYEAALPNKFDMSLTAICGYSEDDMKVLTPQQIRMLHGCHKSPAWT